MAPVKRQNTKRRVLAVVVGKLVGCCDHQPKGTEDEAGWTMMTWGRQDLDSGLNTNLYRALMVLAKQELKRLASLYGVYDHRIHIFLYIYIALDLDICFPHPYVIYISARPEQLGLPLHAYAHAGAMAYYTVCEWPQTDYARIIFLVMGNFVNEAVF